MIAQLPPSELPAWLQQAHAAGHTPLLLDVREAAECQAASVHPEGAELLQLPMHTVPAQLHRLDPDRPTAVLCHHGGRSQQVAWFLLQHGFAQVVNIAGGIDAWSRQLDPSVPRY